MEKKILVAYASKYGATAEIAEKISTVLNEAGLSTSVSSVKEVRGLASYDAVILGSAVYIGQCCSVTKHRTWPRKKQRHCIFALSQESCAEFV